MDETVNFICLKWGTKYGPEYVNRLKNSIAQTYSGSFNFYCFTDDPDGVECETIDIHTLSHFSSKVFTVCKLDLFNELPFQGPCVLLDLDILILKDLKPYFDEYGFREPRFIKCMWQETERIYESYYRGDCYVNSSFVTWRRDQLKWLSEKFDELEDVAHHKIPSFDKFIFYTSRKRINFHPPKLVYAYSFGSEWPDEEAGVFRPEYSVCIFNTSHNQGVELHEATGWALDKWLSYD